MVFMIDSHVHSVFRSFEDFETLGVAGVTDIISVAFYPIVPSSPATLVDHFRHIVEAEPARFNGSCVKFHPAVGVHPRCIPPDVGAVFNYLKSIVDVCVAVGEVGLETATKVEMEVLKEQLRLAKDADLPVIIHTPRKGKREVTVKVLNLVREVGYYNVVIDHVNLENVSLVADLDVHVGLTVQRNKLSLEDLLKIVQEHVIVSPEKFLLNTDLGRDPSDLFALPKAIHYLRLSNVDLDVIDLISRKNASFVFGI